MSDVAISVENISKCYRIGTQGGPAYHRLSEMITGVPRALWNAGKSLARKSSTKAVQESETRNSGEFWALKDVSFEVKQGEVVGIIGRNGAGKSTLLKILSRITEPTSGRFGVRGRVASLLEVGTGFHPELTGRENIYVSGVTLGMTRAEIKKRFDEIVEFSGVEEFLDTPVKNYSSGMQVRLGFAVAAHLESEILIVDEVLAVGDADFQKKCLGKMELAAAIGRSVLFVSHNIAAVRSLCEISILLEKSTVSQQGKTGAVLANYLCQSNISEIDYGEIGRTVGDDCARLCTASLKYEGDRQYGCPISSPIHIEITYELLKDQLRVFPNFHITDVSGNYVFVTADVILDPESDLKRAKGRYRARCTIPGNFLNSETYFIGVALTSRTVFKVHFFEPQALHLNVVETASGAITRFPDYAGKVPGIIRPILNWESERLA